ncbi:MAG: hypothetical protein AAGC57_20665 [Pseudomonadota bacterium]
MREMLHGWSAKLRRALGEVHLRSPKIYELGIQLMDLALAARPTPAQRTAARSAIAAELVKSEDAMSVSTRLDRDAMALLETRIAAVPPLPM